MTKLELMKQNKERYKEYSNNIDSNSKDLKDLVGQYLILPWIKGSNWLGGLSDSIANKAFEKIMSFGYTKDEVFDEYNKQMKSPIFESIENKKKKSALGAFVTLDVGDVEKTIDIFNDSVSDNIGNNTMIENKALMEELLAEGKIVTFDGDTNPSEGWIVVMAGGSGSGKGFVFDTLVPFHGKKLDPDELKPYIIKTSEIMGDEIVFKDGSKINLEDEGIYPPYNMRNDKFVALIHNHPLTKKLKKQQKDMLFRSASSADKSRLPNIIFDMTLDELSKIEAIVYAYKPLGYKIAVVYVFTPIDVAVEQNAKRARQVPKDVLLEIHRGVYKTLPQLLNNPEVVSQINDIWVVQQYHVNAKNKEDLLKYIKQNNVTKLPKSPEGVKYLEKEMEDFVEQQLSRIAELEKEMHDNNLKQKSVEEAEFGSSMEGGKMMEAFLSEDDDFEDANPQTWEEVYSVFEDIIEQYFPSIEIINDKVNELYSKHKGEEIWDIAYGKWTKFRDEDDLEEDFASANEEEEIYNSVEEFLTVKLEDNDEELGEIIYIEPPFKDGDSAFVKVGYDVWTKYDELDHRISQVPIDSKFIHNNNSASKPLYVIKDRYGNQLSSPSENDHELWDRVDDYDPYGKRGLRVVAYQGEE